jgi:hypothetical protein
MKSRLSIALALVLVPLAGCGGGGGGSASGSDPAKLVPASAPVYAEATLRPQGAKRDDAEAAAKKLLKTDNPGEKITGLLDKALENSGVSWDDLKGWLGERAGVFFTSFEGKSPNGAVIFDSTDSGKAKDTIHKGLTHRSSDEDAPKVSKRSYKGVDYEVDTANDNAGGIVGGYAVVGSEAGFKQVVDTSKGGRNLTSVADFNSSRRAVGAGDALAHAWVNPQTLLDMVASSGQAPSSALPLIRQIFAQFGRTAAASFRASGDALRLDAAAVGTPSTAAGTSGAEAAAALPSDAWLAIGFGDLGGTLRKALGQFEQIGQLGSVDVGGIMSQFEQRSGLNIKRDLLSWMGDGAVYARGRSLADIGFVFTAKSNNPARSRVAAKKVAHALHQFGAQVRPGNVVGYDSSYLVRLSGAPIALFVASSADRFSIGVNPRALSDVVHPQQTLGSAPSYASATKALGAGVKPALLIDFPTVVQLLESFGLGNNPAYSKAKPYLDTIGVIAAGATHSGDSLTARLAVALR